MTVEDLQKMFAEYLLSKGGLAKSEFDWSPEKEKEFDSIPIETLIDDPYFLNQKDDLYPAHKDDILELFERKQNGEDIRLFLDSEAIGSGKTHKAAVILWILLYKNIIKHDFKKYYPNIGKDFGLAFLCTSRTSDLAKEVTFEKVLPFFLKSPFFKDYFPPEITWKDIEEMKRKPDRLRFPRKILLFTQPGLLGELGAIGYDLIAASIDEVNFFPVVSDSKRAQNRDGVFDAADELVSSTLTRISSRFLVGGRFPVYSLVHAFSARRGKNDFLEQQIRLRRNDPTVFIRNRPIWEAKPKHTWCGETFEFDTETMKILNLSEAVEKYKKNIGEVDITENAEATL